MRRNGITLDPRRPEPLFQQIVDQITDRVRTGAYPPGYRLPPTRRLAEELGTHRNTVVRAFDELTTLGILTPAVGRGTFVADDAPGSSGGAPEKGAGKGNGSGASSVERPGLSWASLRSRIAEAEPLGRIDRLTRGQVQPPAHAIQLNRMQPSPDLLPSDELRRCIDHVMRTRKGRALGYAPRDGVPRLRELIATDLVRQGVPARAEDLLITTGSQQALDLIARTLVNPGDPFLVEESTYGGVLNVLAAAGARIVPVPNDDEGPSLAGLARHRASGAKGFYVMPNCQNPTGTVISERRREALVEWSHAAGVPLIEDDYGSELDLDGRPAPVAMRALDGDVLHLGTFSKKLIPALRVGFLLCPPALKPHLVALKHAMDLGTSELLQEALAELLERGYLRAHLARSLPEYRARRDALEGALAKSLPAGLSWRHPERGVVLWLPLPAELEPDVVFAEGQREGVLVSPSTLHSVDPRGSAQGGGVRLTFCAEPCERLVEGGRRLGRAIERVLAKSPKRGDAPAPVLGPI